MWAALQKPVLSIGVTRSAHRPLVGLLVVPPPQAHPRAADRPHLVLPLPAADPLPVEFMRLM
jgi:hypothetical protein